MTKRYKTLQKKLKELKAELIYVFSLPGEKAPYHQLLCEEIEQRFLFIKKLLSAEIASHPSKPHHLHHIARRLSEYESAFREWDDHMRSTATAVVNNFDDTASVCSCDDSCRNDDGEAYCDNDDGLVSFPEGLVDVNVEQDLEKIKGESEGNHMIMKQVKAKGGYFGALISGMVLGAVLMGVTMLQFSGCFYFPVRESFLIPT